MSLRRLVIGKREKAGVTLLSSTVQVGNYVVDVEGFEALALPVRKLMCSNFGSTVHHTYKLQSGLV